MGVLRKTTGFVTVTALIGVATAASQQNSSQPHTNISVPQKNNGVQVDLSQSTNTTANPVSPTNTSSVNGSSNSAKSSVQVTVNGQNIPVPANTNGSTHKVINSSGTITTLDISNDHSGSGTSFNSNITSTSLNGNASITTQHDTEINYDSP